MRPDSPNPDRAADGTPAEAVDRAAAIDDYLGGFADHSTLRGTDVSGFDEAAFAGALDMLLLLRQAAAADGVASPAMSRTPQSIGRYEVLRMAGQGGFALVWEAFDPVLRRRVAVKTLRPEAILSPTMRRRFLREAEIASRLVHPHIVTLFEVGCADDREFITGEFCDGGSLADWLSRHPGPMPPRTAVRLALALARAVAHAHEAGVVHRDIKPANVMLAPADPTDVEGAILTEGPAAAPGRGEGPADGWTVKLGDFGLGKLEDGADDAESLTQLTATGSRLGTPAWMAPEQIDRSFGSVGPTTDVHALGLLLDRLLTGRCLRGGKTDAETYREVLLVEALPANRVARGVPADLAALCLKCLAKRQAERYPTVRGLAEDLSRWLEGKPTRARPLSPAARLARSIVRRPVVASLVAASLLTTTIATWAAVERSRERQRGLAQQEAILRQNAAGELRRGFEALRAGNVAGAIDQLAKTRSIDPALAESLAGRWLRRRMHGEREILLGDTTTNVAKPAELHCLALSPDAKAAAVGDSAGRLHVLHSLERAAEIDVVRAHDEINDVCFSPDGTVVATVGQDGRLRWWSTKGGLAPLGEAPAVGGPLYAVSFSPAGDAIYFGGEDRVLRRIDVGGTGPSEEVHRCLPIEGGGPEIEVMAFVGQALAVACGDQIIMIDPAAGRMIRALEWDDDRDPGSGVIHALAASPAGDRIVAGGTDRAPLVWNAQTGELVVTLPAHPHWIHACRFSPDGRRVATACRDGVVRVFDVSTAALVQQCVGHTGRVWDLDFVSDQHLLTAGADGTLRRWESAVPPAEPGLRDIPFVGSRVFSIRDASLGDGSSCRGRLLVLRDSGAPQLVSMADGQASGFADSSIAESGYAAVDRSRGRVAFSILDAKRLRRTVVLPLPGMATAAGVAVRPRGEAPAGPRSCWTPAGGLVICGHDLRMLACTPELDEVTEIGRSDLPLPAMSAAPAGPTRVAWCGLRGSIVGLPPSGGPPLALPPPSDPASALAWSPDGATLACGLRHGGVHVIDGATGTQLAALAPHEREIADVAFSADGRVLLTADAGCVRFSDAATLTTFDELRPGWTIETMCVADDGSFIAIGGSSAGGPQTRRARLAVLEIPQP